MDLLIIEDNHRLVANFFDYFEPRGHIVDAAPDGDVGLWLASTHAYDAIVLDWMLPRLDGCQLLHRLRQEKHITTPVIMLTARDQLPDKVSGFRADVDDYLTKPFDFLELEVRLEALLVRTSPHGRAHRLCVGDLCFDLDTLDITRAGQTLQLYPAGRTLLRTLMQASPAVVTHARLARALARHPARKRTARRPRPAHSGHGCAAIRAQPLCPFIGGRP